MSGEYSSIIQILKLSSTVQCATENVTTRTSADNSPAGKDYDCPQLRDKLRKRCDTTNQVSCVSPHWSARYARDRRSLYGQIVLSELSGNQVYARRRRACTKLVSRIPWNRSNMYCL